MFSLICDRCLTRKLATILGSTDSLEIAWSADSADMIDVRLRLRGWTCSEPLSRGLVGERRGAGRTYVMLRSTSAFCTP